MFKLRKETEINPCFFSSPMLSSHIVSTVGILKCTEMRGFTLEWDEFSIRLSRLGQQVKSSENGSVNVMVLFKKTDSSTPWISGRI